MTSAQLPHLLAREALGKARTQRPIHRSASRKVAGARSLGHTEKPDSTATTSAPGKGRKAKAVPQPRSAQSPEVGHPQHEDELHFYHDLS